MNTFQAMQAPVTMRIGGVDYPVRLLNLRELSEASAWIDAHVSSPLDNAIRAIARAKSSGTEVDPDLEEKLLGRADEAMLAWPPRPGTKPWFDALDSNPSGAAELVRVILSRTVNGFDTMQAEMIHDAMSADELSALVMMGVYGVRPKDGKPVPEAKEKVPDHQAMQAKVPDRHDARSPEDLREAASEAVLAWGQWRE